MTQFLSLVLVAVLYASTILAAAAAPRPIATDRSTHHLRLVGVKKELRIETYHPKSTFKTYGKGLSRPVSFNEKSLEDVSITFTSTEAGIHSEDIVFHRGFKSPSTGVEHAYLKQQHLGIPILNTSANIALKEDKVLTFGSSFIDTKSAQFPPSEPSVDLEAVISGVEAFLNGVQAKEVKATLAYLIRSDFPPALVHVVQIHNEEEFTWYEAYIDAHSGELLSVADFVNDLSYTVIPIQKTALPDGMETLVDPEDLDASPNGWVINDETAGNNAVTYRSSVANTSHAPFNHAYDDTLEPAEENNLDASRVNAFYLINTLHDIWYKYGFTEEAFNFQNDNFGKGGVGGDRVMIRVQDGSGSNNANFITLPDGQPGSSKMYLWNHTDPKRDGALDTCILVHEYTHGLTNRLAGGGTALCLQTKEAGGMGEGWGDAMAEWADLETDEVPDYVFGAYAADQPGGIRTVPYSIDHSVNPLMYSTIQQLDEVHKIGEVWATILHGVLTSLVHNHGFNASVGTQPDGTEGNIVYLHLFIDALSLQPCNPTMVDVRDAWIQADENRYEGANRCLLWKAFADRGLGLEAGNYVDDISIPSDC